MNGKTPLDWRMGPKTFLSPAQENTIVKEILSMAKEKEKKLEPKEKRAEERQRKKRRR